MSKLKSFQRTKDPSPLALYEGLISKGLSPEVAAAKVAALWGLQVTSGGYSLHWTIAEVQQLLFLAHRMDKVKEPV